MKARRSARHEHRRRAAQALFALTFCAALGEPVRAQQPATDLAPDSVPEPDPWSGEASFGGNVYIGNVSFYNLVASAGVERADDLTELSLSVGARYGQTTSSSGKTTILRRSWRVRAGADYRPKARVSPFVFGAVERSLFARIDGRASIGAGAKLAFVRQDTTRLDLSAALMAERTDPRLDPAPPDENFYFTRWSFRLRGRKHLLRGKLQLSAVLFYRPKLNDTSIYTFEIDARVDVRLNNVLGLRVAFVDLYDSQAQGRGARSNNDGQLIIGLTSSF